VLFRCRFLRRRTFSGFFRCFLKVFFFIVSGGFEFPPPTPQKQPIIGNLPGLFLHVSPTPKKPHPCFSCSFYPSCTFRSLGFHSFSSKGTCSGGGPTQEFYSWTFFCLFFSLLRPPAFKGAFFPGHQPPLPTSHPPVPLESTNF